MLQDEISGLIPVNPEGGKEVRANAVSPEVESDNVYLPHPLYASWVNELIDEATAFPNGRYDDMVDSLTQALVKLQHLRVIL
ncbi:phage terminase large subunit [Priestia megaterium]